MSEANNRIMNNELFINSQKHSIVGGNSIQPNVNVITNHKDPELVGGYIGTQKLDVNRDINSGKQGFYPGNITFSHSWFPEISKVLYQVSNSNLSIQDKRVRILLLIFQWIRKQQCELVDPGLLFSPDDIETVYNHVLAYQHFLTKETPIDDELLKKCLNTGFCNKKQKLDNRFQSKSMNVNLCSSNNDLNNIIKDDEFRPDWEFINSIIKEPNNFSYKVPLSRQGSSISMRNPNQWIEYNRKVEQNRMALLINRSSSTNSSNNNNNYYYSSNPANSYMNNSRNIKNEDTNMASNNINIKPDNISNDLNSNSNLHTDNQIKTKNEGNTIESKVVDKNEDLTFRISKLLNFQQYIRNQVIVSRYLEEMNPLLPQLKNVTARDARKNKALYHARMDGLKYIKTTDDIKRQRRQFISEVLKYSKKFVDIHRENQRSIRRLCSHVLRHTSNKERRDQNMEQQMQKARLNALRAQDEEAYLRLLHEAKNERLLELVQQTEEYMNKLGALVMEHRKQAGSLLDYDMYREEEYQSEKVDSNNEKHLCTCCSSLEKDKKGNENVRDYDEVSDGNQLNQERMGAGRVNVSEVKMEDENRCECNSKDCTCSISISNCKCSSEMCCSKKVNNKSPAPLIKAKERYFQVTHMVQEQITEQPKCLKGGQLREYQMKGLEWLVSLYNNNLNGILADAMGLGKTVQTVSVLAHIYEKRGNRGPHLIIAPLSTLHGNWENEFNKWLPDFVKVIYEGNKETRKQIRSKYMTGEAKFHVLLTTDAFIMKDKHYLRKFDWEYIIVDEAHRLKNPKSKLVQILNSGFRAKHRLALTGTPLQNDLQEVWALLNYLMPSIFNSSDTFQQWFNEPLSSIKSTSRNGTGSDSGIVPLDISEEEQLLIVDRLHKVLRPFLLRREKIQVANEVPPKLEEILWCPLSGLQQHLYKELESNENSGPNVLMQLRKVCNHPFLFSTELQYPSDESIVRVCGKFVMLDSILPKLRAAGHRVLIFSQMTKLLTLLEIFLSLRNMSFLRLDGTTLSEDRQESLKLFNAEDSPYFVFLLSTKAGGFGINLQSADTVILFDSDWNPQNDEQAQSRAHRIGQKREVLTLRFVTPDTVEERIMTTAGIKLDKDALIIKSGMYYDMYDGDDLEQKRKEKIQEILRKQRQKEVVNCYYDSDRLNRIIARSDRDLEIFERVDRMRKMCHIPGLIVDPILPPCLFDWKKQAKISKITVENIQKAEELWKICYTSGDPWVVYPNKRNKKYIKEIAKIHKSSSAVNTLYLNNCDNNGISRSDSKNSQKDNLIKTRSRLQQEKEENSNSEYNKDNDNDTINDIELDQETLSCVFDMEKNTENENNTKDEFNPVNSDIIKGILEQEQITQEEIEYRKDTLNNSILKACELAMKIPEYEAYIALPPQTTFPDYYQIITKPVCLQHIKQFAKKKEFTSLHKLEKYLERLATNAKTYNGITHYLYHSALHLINTVMMEVRKRVSVAYYTYKLPEGHIRDNEAKQLLDGLNSVSDTDFNKRHMLVPDVGDDDDDDDDEKEDEEDYYEIRVDNVDSRDSSENFSYKQEDFNKSKDKDNKKSDTNGNKNEK
ncbi:brahma like protein with a HSA domain [Cryptosporidium ryanae]|uniref:brahma like protein with a HSA domain n=1 Tax=Cryptosporidium ryanae TaxID=515981 RepID=UPI00351A5099|nr:brahma like protein with a HSA domain [Cryptosporidium ryanae]